MNMIKKHDKTLLYSGPTYLNNENTIGTYENLHKVKGKSISSEDFTYKYALEFDLFIDNIGENFNENSNTFTSVFSYGDKPNILYNIKDNKLQITCKKGMNGTNIIYETDTFQLQKWNNIVINYIDGVIDVFINNKLVGTSEGNISYMNYDLIKIGSDNGISGGIKNIHYYKNKNLIL